MAFIREIQSLLISTDLWTKFWLISIIKCMTCFPDSCSKNNFFFLYTEMEIIGNKDTKRLIFARIFFCFFSDLQQCFVFMLHFYDLCYFHTQLKNKPLLLYFPTFDNSWISLKKLHRKMHQTVINKNLTQFERQKKCDVMSCNRKFA